MKEVWRFVRLVAQHWVTLMSGGIVMVAIAFYERRSGRDAPFYVFLIIAFAFIVWACFLAWRDEYRKRLTAEQSVIEIKDSKRAKIEEEYSRVAVEFNRIRMALLTSIYAPTITAQLGSLKTLFLENPILLHHDGVAHFFRKWIQPNEIHLMVGASLNLNQEQYQEMRDELADINLYSKQIGEEQ